MNYGSLTYIQAWQAPQPGLEHRKYKNRNCCFSALPLSYVSLTHPSVTLVTITIAIQHLRSLTYLMTLFMTEYLSLNALCQAEKQWSACLPMDCQSPASCTHKHTYTHTCIHVDMHRYTETSLISIVVCKIHMLSPRQVKKSIQWVKQNVKWKT